MSTSPEQIRAVVVGAGVSGLTSAHELARAGYSVRVVAREPCLQTTSSVAPAIWWAYDLEPTTSTRQWAPVGLERFRSIATSNPEAGIRIRHGVHRRRLDVEAPWFASLVDAEPAVTDDGVVVQPMTSPIVDMPIYLAWLQQMCAASGVVFEFADFTSLGEITNTDVIVNCSGVGAATLVDDSDVRPLRGQVAVVTGTGIDEFVKDESVAGVVTYIYPRTDSVVLGSTAEYSADTTVDDMTTAAIVDRCALLDARVANGTIVDVRVGLRPARQSVRMELEMAATPIVHSYGHGRAGVSLSWGCAAEVVLLCNKAVSV